VNEWITVISPSMDTVPQNVATLYPVANVLFNFYTTYILNFPVASLRSLHHEIWLLDSQFGYCRTSVAQDLPSIYRIFRKVSSNCGQHIALFGYYTLQFRYCTSNLATVPRIWLFYPIAWLPFPARSLYIPQFVQCTPQYYHYISHFYCLLPRFSYSSPSLGIVSHIFVNVPQISLLCPQLGYCFPHFHPYILQCDYCTSTFVQYIPNFHSLMPSFDSTLQLASHNTQFGFDTLRFG
jgi:hypothetical protein